MGRYGDSYGAAPSDWVALAVGEVGGSSWDEEGQACAGMALGADLQLFHAKFGAAVDLQEQIVGARLTYRTGTWRLASSGRMLFTVAVSFVEVPTGAAAEFVPPPPGLLAPLPEDAFYPFRPTSTAAR